jgi:sialate O-acetylesterase
MRFSKPLALASFFLAAQPLGAEVTLAPLFREGGVLQRDKPIPILGYATAGKVVRVSFADQTLTTTTNAVGKWQVTLSPMPANAAGQVLTVTEEGLAAVEVKDLLVGEVWLASGQSNMEMKVHDACQEDRDAAAAGTVPLLRLLNVPRQFSHIRQENFDSKWVTATPENAANFSAVAYFFGKKIAEEIKVPIGIIHSSVGGSRIETWWAEEGLAGIEPLANTRWWREQHSPGFPDYDKRFRSYIDTIQDWSGKAAKAMDAGLPAPAMPPEPAHLRIGLDQEAGTYQAMIHPLVPYALRGFIWYQGEANYKDGMSYIPKMEALIAGWRHQFKAAEAPFYYVQIAPCDYDKNHPTELPNFWWAQQQVMKIPHTGMVVTNDIGEEKNIHPAQKQAVGKRLARWALADTYGQKNVVKSGPLFAGYSVKGSSLTVRFDYPGIGLMTRDGKAASMFEIAGEDEVYHPADADISADGKSIILSHFTVANPDRARFAWDQTAMPNLQNSEGLPAAAFNTHWPHDPTLGRIVSAGKPYVSSHPNTYGWHEGLTDSSWGNDSGHCYATDPSETFPKTVTIDLGSASELQAIRYGTPEIGSTKTVAISISEDGQAFRELGRKDFPENKEDCAVLKFTPQKARYVRATFLENYPIEHEHKANYCFLRELEAYAR